MSNLVATVKHIIPIVIILAVQQKSFGQTTFSDTTFILGETKNDIYHAIYIDSNKTSKYYDWISTFEFGKFDTANYASSIADLKEKKSKPFAKHKLSDLPRQWCSLYGCKEKFYLYSPCDYMFNYKLAISDTTYIDYFGDGPTAIRINTFTVIDNNTYKFSVATYDQFNRVIVIHIIDKKNGIAIFEESSEIEEHKFYLMVMAGKVKNFPIIVNYSAAQKQKEFKFDDINFEKFLNRN